MGVVTMTRYIMLSLAALLCSDSVPAQVLSVVKADYARVRNGEQIGAGSFVFADDGRIRHDRLARDGDVMMSHIWAADGDRRIDVDHALRTAVAAVAGMVRDSTGAVRVPAPGPGWGYRTEMLPLGPRAVGPLVLEGFRADIPAREGQPAAVMEMWGYRPPGQDRMHFLERTTRSTNPDGSPYFSETRVVYIQRVPADDTVFNIPPDIAIDDLSTRPQPRR